MARRTFLDDCSRFVGLGFAGTLRVYPFGSNDCVGAGKNRYLSKSFVGAAGFETSAGCGFT